MKKIITIFATATLVLSSCSDFLECDSPTSTLSSQFFKNEAALEAYANGMVSAYTPYTSDIASGSEYSDYVGIRSQDENRFWLGGWTPEQQAGWSVGDWTELYRCNYFLLHIDDFASNIPENVRNHYKGVARFWRCMFYLDKIQTFGGVKYYNYFLDAYDADGLYAGRDSWEKSMHLLLEDVNAALELTSDDRKYVNCGVVNKYMVALLKSRICLFAGTYLKYHKVNPENGKPWTGEFESAEDYLKECVKACEVVMESGLYSIKPTSSYSGIFKHIGGCPYDEVLWWYEHSKVDVISNNLTWRFLTSAGNNWSVNRKFINTYLNSDGSRYTDKSGYDRDDFITEFTNRDLRLSQTLIGPDYKRDELSDGNYKNYVPHFTVSYTGYQIHKWAVDEGSDSQFSAYNSLPIFRYAEVLLNYAEAKAELGALSQEDWNKTIAVLRARAGISDTSMPATADPYLVSYYNGSVSDKNILEVRRERGIELFMEGNLRYQDLMRWHCGELTTNDVQGIYAEKNKKYRLNNEGDPQYVMVCDVPGKDTDTQYVVPSETVLYKNNHIVYKAYTRVWEEKMYLHPIPAGERLINTNLVQNYGW